MLSQFVTPDLVPAIPEIFLLAATCALLLAGSLLRLCSTTRYALSLITLLGTLLFVLMGISPKPIATFGGMFTLDLFASMLKLSALAAVLVVLVYSKKLVQPGGRDSVEYYGLTLFATLGMMVMISGANFVTLYLGLELLSLSLYALVALDRDSARSTEAAMKYFVLGALASGLLLYGMSMVYGATGSLDLADIASQLQQGMGAKKTVLVLGLVFIVSGLAFKLGVVPFHMWVPDVYQGAPAAITLMLASAPKLAAFALLMRLLVGGLLSLVEHWQLMLLMLAMASIALGNLAAIAQTNIKRMLAYSGISHMGFMLLAIASGVLVDVPMDMRGRVFTAVGAYGSAFYYMLAYVLMSLGGFGMVVLLSRPGFEAEHLADFKGLNQRSPWFAAMMLILMFSMAGIPFFIGFFAKFAVLVSLVHAGYVAVAVAAVLFSLVGAFYYLRVVKYMYFDAPAADAPALLAPWDMRVLLSVNVLAVAVLGLLPEIMMRWSTLAVVYAQF